MIEPQLQGLIDVARKRLKPIPTLSSKLPFQKFARPFEQFAQGVAAQQTPFFNFFTADPFRQQLRGSIAAGGGARTGFAQGTSQRTLRELFQPLQQQISGPQGILEQFRAGVTTPLFKRRIEQFSRSPQRGLRF